MKTKKEILKMSEEELISYKWDNDLNEICYPDSTHTSCSNCDGCYNCTNCSDCYICIHCSNCSYCSDCHYCSSCFKCLDCSNCNDCHNCYLCRNAKGLKYAICNVELTEEEYKEKMKELKDDN